MFTAEKAVVHRTRNKADAAVLQQHGRMMVMECERHGVPWLIAV
jgi:hypothetical protein